MRVLASNTAVQLFSGSIDRASDRHSWNQRRDRICVAAVQRLSFPQTSKKQGVRRFAETRCRWPMSIQLAVADRSNLRGFH